jgi:hypothetical protein
MARRIKSTAKTGASIKRTPLAITFNLRFAAVEEGILGECDFRALAKDQ